VKELRPGGPYETYQAILIELRGKALRSATANKPTMWAYYADIADRLEREFEDALEDPDDGGLAGCALAISQIAENDCPKLPRQEAAQLWAVSVYARRILGTWGGGNVRVSLDWLRKRAASELAVLNA
jgi:hypothetical protein